LSVSFLLYGIVNTQIQPPGKARVVSAHILDDDDLIGQDAQ